MLELVSIRTAKKYTHIEPFNLINDPGFLTAEFANPTVP